MSASVLGSVTLGYEPIWNRLRRCCGVRLFIDANRASAVDAEDLLDAFPERVVSYVETRFDARREQAA